MYRYYKRNQKNEDSNYQISDIYPYSSYTYPILKSNKYREEKIDFGPEPFATNINKATIDNKAFRRALWTGNHLQLTLMSIDVGSEIGLEIHPEIDQLLRIEQGEGIALMGNSKDNLSFQQVVKDDSIILIPSGTWHNVINTGTIPLKLYSVYAPPQHPYGTVHQTKKEAEEAEEDYHH